MTAQIDQSATPLGRVLAETGMLRSLRSALKPGPGERSLTMSAAVAAEFGWNLGQLIADLDELKSSTSYGQAKHQAPRPPPRGNVDRPQLTLANRADA